jgi:hypothetical protein
VSSDPLDELMGIYCPCILKDPTADVVLSTLNTINQMTKQMGPAAIEPYMDALSPGTFFSS